MSTNNKKDGSDNLDLISDVLDKLIDIQSHTIEQLTIMSNHLNDISDQVKETGHKFTNGFRSELKSHVSNEIQEMKNNCKVIEEGITNINNTICDILKTTKSPTFWLKMILSFMIAIATVTGSVGTCIYTLQKNSWEQSKLLNDSTKSSNNTNDPDKVSDNE